ncbi:helix-turn-helix domain-containing protein [Variovorax sp. VaC1]|uniref:helix-turn-helix domain-containing protein n=1 Tax=Variovorax sp. VaC1 TaxID=3373132 RepID=UPI003747E28E
MSSPFSHLLHELRLRHTVRQADLAALMGYEQSYVSALEIGLKGPPTPEFVEKLIAALPLTAVEADEVRVAVEASQRKLLIDVDAPQDVYLLLHELRRKLPSLSPKHVRLVSDILAMTDVRSEPWSDPLRRIRRKKKEASPDVGSA